MAKRGLNIHKRQDGRWEGRYCKSRSFAGTIVYGYVYGKTYKETKEKVILASLEPQKTHCITKDDKHLKMKDLLSLWMQHNRIRQKGATVAKYQFIIDNHLVPDLGELYISQVNATMLNNYLLEKLDHGRLDHKGGLSASYVSTITIILKSAMKYAEDEKLCSHMNSQVFKPTSVRHDLPILDLAQQKRLEQYVVDNLFPTNIGIMISLHTGLRIGEICALSWDDIDLDNCVIHVRHTIARVQASPDSNHVTSLILDTPKTKASLRDIPISSFLSPILKEARENKKSQYVVSEKNGFLSPRTYEYRYHRILEACDIERINYHALRHTFATRCIEVGVDVKSLSEMLGHANVSITLETYVHSSMKLKRSQLEKLALTAE